MLPSLVAEDLRASLTSFLGTTFALADDDVRAELERFVADPKDGVFRGPFVRLRLPFRPADDGWRQHLDWAPDGFTPAPPPGRGVDAARVARPDAAADAGHHRHRVGQDRGVPDPDPRPLPPAAPRRAARDQGAHALPDERAGQRPGAAHRASWSHGTPRRSAASPPGSTSATSGKAARDDRRPASISDRARHAGATRRTSCSPTTRCSTMLLLRREDAPLCRGRAASRCGTWCSTSSTPTTARRAPTSRCCCAGSAWRSASPRTSGRSARSRRSPRPRPSAGAADGGPKLREFAETVFGAEFDEDVARRRGPADGRGVGDGAGRPRPAARPGHRGAARLHVARGAAARRRAALRARRERGRPRSAGAGGVAARPPVHPPRCCSSRRSPCSLIDLRGQGRAELGGRRR